MDEILQISDSELILMQLIWEKGGIALFAEIFDEIQQRNVDWKYNTVITFLSRLVEKGFLKTNKIGRRNEYKALISAKEYHTAQTKLFVDKVYEGNVLELINTLMGQSILSVEEKEELRKYWNSGEEK